MLADDDASHFLNILATIPASFPIKLAKRVEYLSLAVGNAKSHQVSDYDQMDQAPVEFLNELEEQLEVANVQLEVFDAMQSLSGLTQEALRDIDELGTYLTDVTDVCRVITTHVTLLSDYDLNFAVVSSICRAVSTVRHEATHSQGIRSP